MTIHITWQGVFTVLWSVGLVGCAGFVLYGLWVLARWGK